MKKIILILSLSILGTIFYSCTKENDSIVSKNSNSSVNKTRSDMISYIIPDDCKAKSDYAGEVIVNSEKLTAVINDITYEGTLYAECDTNGYLIYVGYSEVMSNAFELDENVLFNDEIHAMILDAITSNNKSFFGKVWGAIKFTFWGEPKQTPCVLNRNIHFTHHWLIGNHTFSDPMPC